MSSSNWAVSQLSNLLPLDDTSLNEVLDYTSTLPKDAAAENLKNLLGDSPKALEFISGYNARREAPSTKPSQTEAPKNARKAQKKKPPLNNLPPPRQVEDHGNVPGAYQKKNEEDYTTSNKGRGSMRATPSTFALSNKPDAQQLPKTTPAASSKPPPSAAGPLISDLPNIHSSSRTSSRTSSPAPKTKINVAGGAPMHGASTTLQDLFMKDSAIRSLELQTNPSLTTADPSARRCNCNATRHPLLAVAPNCTNCGKIICVKEGLGPCTFCSAPILSSTDIHSMIESLRQERGQERMNANNASYRRADVASTPRAFQTSQNTATSSLASRNTADKTLDLAKEHRDRLLAYQAENARRTQIIDEAADFETPTSGLSMWSSPIERAAQLKRQQKVLREQEWNAKPEYEKRRMVVSVDLVGGKVVKRMGDVERLKDEELDDGGDVDTGAVGGGDDSGGAFSKNSLMGGLIRPVWKGKGQDMNVAGNEDNDKENQPRKSTWRRVQDDNDDNEEWILDGGIYGDNNDERRLGDEKHAYG
ncbi:hypothetical protein ACLMJK_001042 [Lecanora helva]